MPTAIHDNTKTALVWITDIVKQLDIPFQIAGGLAAVSYGVKRPLHDIDLDIPENQFAKLSEVITDYIIFGPEQFKDDKWDLLLMTINYHGQLIDFGGAYQAKVFNTKAQCWYPIPVDFKRSESRVIANLTLPVVPLAELIRYKRLLAREFDLLDLAQLGVLD